MNILGIIAEYNPFHNGHQYHIAQAKALSRADICIVVMSGNFVQRGDIAVFDKYLRAEMAVRCGADLVIELPICAATSSAEHFADAAIHALLSLGVNAIVFGSECNNLSLLNEIARIFTEEPEAYKRALKAGLAEGNAFAPARANALCEYASQIGFHSDAINRVTEDQLQSLLSAPNNILAIEYLKSLRRRRASYVTVQTLSRIGEYHGLTPTDSDAAGTDRISYLSATGIRNLIHEGNAYQSYMPAPACQVLTDHADMAKPLFLDDMSTLLNYQIFRSDHYTGFSDMNEELSNRILKCKDRPKPFSEWVTDLTSKTYPASRVRRALLHMTLNISSYSECNYARILALHSEVSFSGVKRSANEQQFFLLSSAADVKNFIDSGFGESDQLKNDIVSYDIYRMLYDEKYHVALPKESERRMCVIASSRND